MSRILQTPSIKKIQALSVREGSLILDCSGDSFDLTAGIVESTAYFTAALKITDIYFYGEE